jgi:hypothetical protein
VQVRLILDRAAIGCEDNGSEILARVRAERPELYFKELLNLTLALHTRPRTRQTSTGEAIARKYCNA